MNEPVRWVTKAEAAEELAVSLSTLDRKIRQGEIKVRREGRRVFVRMEGPEYPSDEEVLLQSLDRERELQRTVRELEQSVSELEQRASELKRERDEARESVSTGRLANHELEGKYRGEVSSHEVTTLALKVFQVAAFVLLVLLIGSVLLRWFVLR